jgi:hypothetical protein
MMLKEYQNAGVRDGERLLEQVHDLIAQALKAQDDDERRGKKRKRS